MPKTLLLPVPLTDEEKLILLDELSLMISQHESLEEQRKALPELIKNLEASLHIKNHAKKNGYVEREVEIREEANPFSVKVQRWRVDTGEQLPDRAMDPEEAQMQLGQSSVPGATPDNVRSLAEARDKSEEQLAAGSPEEAEALREARLADERARWLEDAIGALAIEVVDRGDNSFIAHVEGKVPGVAGEAGLSGPIRDTTEAARAELLDEIRRLAQGSTSWDDVAAASAETQRLAEIERLAADQAADAAKGPKKLLTAPKGSKAKRLKVQDEKGNPLPADENVNGVDTTPPPGLGF